MMFSSSRHVLLCVFLFLICSSRINSTAALCQVIRCWMKASEHRRWNELCLHWSTLPCRPGERHGNCHGQGGRDAGKHPTPPPPISQAMARHSTEAPFIKPTLYMELLGSHHEYYKRRFHREHGGRFMVKRRRFRNSSNDANKRITTTTTTRMQTPCRYVQSLHRPPSSS